MEIPHPSGDQNDSTETHSSGNQLTDPGATYPDLPRPTPTYPDQPHSSPASQSESKTNNSTDSSSKYIIEESPPDFHYDDDHFNQRKFLDVASSWRIVPKSPKQSYLAEFQRLAPYIEKRIRNYFEYGNSRATKVHVTLYCKFWRNKTNPVVFKDFHLDQKSVSILESDDIGEIVRKMFDKFQDRIYVKLEVESDYVFDHLNHADLLFVKWMPVRGSKHIETPFYLQKCTRSLINIKNQDEMCLVWSVLAILYPKKRRRENPDSYRMHLPSLNLTDMDFNSNNVTSRGARTLLSQMEKNNPQLSICCYVVEEAEKSINCFYISDRYVTDDSSFHEVNLLLIERKSLYHFVAITNLKRVVIYLHTRNRSAKCQVCRRCLALIYSESKFDDHRILCQDMDATVCKLPEKGAVYKYTDHPKEVCILRVKLSVSRLVSRSKGRSVSQVF